MQKTHIYQSAHPLQLPSSRFRQQLPSAVAIHLFTDNRADLIRFAKLPDHGDDKFIEGWNNETQNSVFCAFSFREEHDCSGHAATSHVWKNNDLLVRSLSCPTMTPQNIVFVTDKNPSQTENSKAFQAFITQSLLFERLQPLNHMKAIVQSPSSAPSGFGQKIDDIVNFTQNFLGHAIGRLRGGTTADLN